METIVLDGRQTIVLAILVVFLGKFLISRIAFLRNYNIPEPVVGGLIASLVECLVVLPAHLAHRRPPPARRRRCT